MPSSSKTKASTIKDGTATSATPDGSVPQELVTVEYLQISYLKPFPKEKVKKEIEKSKKIFLIENNVTGLLGTVLREETGILIKNKILKYDGRPFTPSEIIKKIK